MDFKTMHVRNCYERSYTIMHCGIGSNLSWLVLEINDWLNPRWQCPIHSSWNNAECKSNCQAVMIIWPKWYNSGTGDTHHRRVCLLSLFGPSCLLAFLILACLHRQFVRRVHHRIVSSLKRKNCRGEESEVDCGLVPPSQISKFIVFSCFLFSTVFSGFLGDNSIS